MQTLEGGQVHKEQDKWEVHTVEDVDGWVVRLRVQVPSRFLHLPLVLP